MSDIMLSCAETPLAWPGSTPILELNTSTTSGIHVYSPQPGSLQILTRRQQGGVGDGVNIGESNTVGADFRGQRYSYDEAIFHTPGLHVFPGQTEVYPAEYHIHLETFAEPRRAITLVIPVSHRVSAPGVDYFAACAAQPDPSATRPTLSTLLTPGTPMVAYRGPDIRGRTADNPSPETCTTSEERQFLLVLSPVQIRASDLERIPREGSLSTDPRDLPALGVAPTTAVTRDRLMRTTVFCMPGIKGAVADFEAPQPSLQCKPITTQGGKSCIDVSGAGTGGLLGLQQQQQQPQQSVGLVSPSKLMRHALIFICVMIGLILADYLVGKLWSRCMKASAGASLDQWEPVKIYYFLLVAGGAAGWL
jgi:hypothetical protein